MQLVEWTSIDEAELTKSFYFFDPHTDDLCWLQEYGHSYVCMHKFQCSIRFLTDWVAQDHKTYPLAVVRIVEDISADEEASALLLIYKCLGGL